jgi:peroxin-11C
VIVYWLIVLAFLAFHSEIIIMNIDDISKFLSTHNGRDNVIRMLSYATKLAAALVSSEETVLKLETISGQLSACRTVLRLFDDIPMLNYTLTYGLGKEVE